MHPIPMLAHPIPRLALRVLATLALAALAGRGGAEAGSDGCERIGLEVACAVTPARTLLIGDPFRATATVRNTGHLPLRGVKLAIEGASGMAHIDTGELELCIALLEPGQTQTLEATFVSETVGECRIRARASDEEASASAGCLCSVFAIGLPALQVEMIDLGLEHQRKGIFEVGETFLYTLEVQNDVGTALTPELRVIWTLPPELVFVSGKADNACTVTGSGQVAQSSAFSLQPDQVQHFEIRVRVLAVSPSNLVQTRAVVVSGAGNQELAIETESTTLRSATK